MVTYTQAVNPPLDTPAGTLVGTALPIPTETKPVGNPTQVIVEQFVRIWLPSEFDPQANSPASRLLKARLDEFIVENPGVSLDVRVKALDGPGGMLDSLVAANAAAPLALPDLVLLSRPLLEAAAVKGLLYPYDGLTNVLDNGGWFDYARQLAQLKSRLYGLPFAGDALVLVYPSTQMNTPPSSLEAILSQKKALLFPAADPQGLFTMCMYLAQAGKLQDNQGRPVLEEKPLVDVLLFYQQASLTDVLPYTLTQYSYDEQVWEALLGDSSAMGVTWATSFLHSSQVERANLALAPLPTPAGKPFSLATGWSWALAGQDPDRRTLSLKLAEFLLDKDFLAEWTWAAGYLPPNLDALAGWQVSQTRQEIEQISTSAALLPSSDILSNLGPALEQAVIDVILGKSDAKSAARSAIDQGKRP